MKLNLYFIKKIYFLAIDIDVFRNIDLFRLGTRH